MRILDQPKESHLTTRVHERAFTVTDLVVVLALLSVMTALAVPLTVKIQEKSRLARCTANLKQVSRAILQYTDAHEGILPRTSAVPPPGGWWTYKEEVKCYLGLTGPASPKDKVFACPSDRGYGEGSEERSPFCRNPKYSYSSYVFNGVTLPGMPNIAGRNISTVVDPKRTLLVMEWTAHAPLSWHFSRTGKANTPFYNDAESVVGFVDGRVSFIKIYYDGMNAAYTRDPLPGYNYKYSGN